MRLALDDCEVHADLECDDAGRHDAWRGLAARLAEVCEHARKVEGT
jgi:hypothetical protein